MIKCWICEEDFEPTADQLKLWAESKNDFDPTDWECTECLKYEGVINYENTN